ncbi:hypothetical protein LTS17_000507 [Exophiala oligosperma]
MGYSEAGRPQWSTTTVGKRNIVLAAILLSLFCIFFTFRNQSPPSGTASPSGMSTSKFSLGGKKDNLGDVYNDTLGFQKVYAINLPERTDKKDNMRLQARATNFSIEIVDGVIGSKVSYKAIPYTFKQNNGTIGCWRAHLNVLQKMIEENIQSALILEDDADWDIGLKAQMAELARGSRWLLETAPEGTSNNHIPHSPYGDGWDMLWVGHCHSEPVKGDNRRWVIPHDPTVAPEGSRWYFKGPKMDKWEKGPDADPQTRVVYQQGFGWCLSGYAVSLRAAQRILWYASMMPFNWPIDSGMGNLCSQREFHDFQCIAPFPRFVGKSTPAGSNALGSDINTKPKEEKIQEKSESENVMFSVRQNMRRILDGATTFKSYFKNPAGDDLTLEQISAARGHPEYVDEEVKKETKE